VEQSSIRCTRVTEFSALGTTRNVRAVMEARQLRRSYDRRSSPAIKKRTCRCCRHFSVSISAVDYEKEVPLIFTIRPGTVMSQFSILGVVTKDSHVRNVTAPRRPWSWDQRPDLYPINHGSTLVGIFMIQMAFWNLQTFVKQLLWIFLRIISMFSKF